MELIKFHLYTREQWLACIQEVSSKIHEKEAEQPEEKHVLEGKKMVNTKLKN